MRLEIGNFYVEMTLFLETSFHMKMVFLQSRKKPH